MLGAMAFGSTGYASVGTLLGLQVYELSRRELDLGLIGMVQFAPSFLLLFVTGSVADRFDRARVCAASMSGQSLVAALLAAYAWSRPTAVAPIFLMVAMLGVARAFLAAAQGPLPADIVEPDRLPWLVARRSLAARAGVIAGPVFGGALYVVDPVLAFGVMAALFAVAAVLFWSIGKRGHAAARAQRPAGPAKMRSWRDGLEGIRVIRSTPILLAAISLDMFAVLFGGAIALLPALAKGPLGVDAVGLGMLRSASGVGATIVLLGLAWKPLKRRIGHTLLVAITVFGIATIVLGATNSFPVALLAVACIAGSDAISVYVRANVVPLASPPDKRGRVSAVESLFIGTSNELGAFESGVTGQLLGASGAVMLGGAATLGVVAVWATRFPVLRKLDGFPNAGANPVPDPNLTETAKTPDSPGSK
jgi:MFS family permease